MDFNVYNMLYSLPSVIIGLTIHEFAHAFTSYKLGDNTAKEQGRLTLNPIKHIDIIGFIFIVLAGFGWAKPVQFSPNSLKNPRRDKALIALAGPISNLLLGFLGIILIKILLLFASLVPSSSYEIAGNLLLYFTFINLGLFIFNILPLPPLDGSHIFFSGLNIPVEIETKLIKYGSYALFIVLFIENRMDIDLIPVGKFTSFIFGLFFTA